MSLNNILGKNDAQVGGNLAASGTAQLGYLPTAITDAFLNNQSNAANQMDWARLAYLQNLGVTGDVVDNFLQSSAIGQNLANTSAERYENVFQPLEDQLIQEANSYASPERRAQNMGAAEAAVAQHMDSQRQNAQRDLESFGLDPSSTRYQGLDLAYRTQQGAAEAGAANQAGLQTDALARALRSEALNIGQRYPGNITAELAAGNQGLTGAENATLAQTASGANTMGTGPSWAQIGNNAELGLGNLINASNSNTINAQRANQTASSGLGGLLGAGAGLVRSAFAEGGPVNLPYPDWGWGLTGVRPRESAIPSDTTTTTNNTPDTHVDPNAVDPIRPNAPTWHTPHNPLADYRRTDPWTPNTSYYSRPPLGMDDSSFGHYHVGGQGSYNLLANFIGQLLSRSQTQNGTPVPNGGGDTAGADQTVSGPVRMAATTGAIPTNASLTRAGGDVVPAPGAGNPPAGWGQGPSDSALPVGVGSQRPLPYGTPIAYGQPAPHGGGSYGYPSDPMQRRPTPGMGGAPVYWSGYGSNPSPGAVPVLTATGARFDSSQPYQIRQSMFADGGPVRPNNLGGILGGFDMGADEMGSAGISSNNDQSGNKDPFASKNDSFNLAISQAIPNGPNPEWGLDQTLGNPAFRHADVDQTLGNPAFQRPAPNTAPPPPQPSGPPGWNNPPPPPPPAPAPGMYAGRAGLSNNPVLRRGMAQVFAAGGSVTPGGQVPPQMSPSRGAIQDDVPALLTSDEFVIPRDVATWEGHKNLQRLVEKARQERAKTTPAPRQAVGPAGHPPMFTSRPPQQGALPLR